MDVRHQTPLEARSPPGGQHSPTAALLFKLDKVPTYSTPPPASNIPENNVCRMIEYRGAKVAAFTVDGRELICLPQAFDLFLKHLVGGLHTVYTKLKRLDITPVVCNVEQVRILRGLGAIQPGVNRCKLIAPKEFDVLYDDCTNSSARPGRPPKRSSSLCSPLSPDPLQRLKKAAKLESSDYYAFTDRYLSEKKSPLLSNGYNHYPHHLAALPFMPHFAHPYAAMSMAAMSGHFAGMRAEDIAAVRQTEELLSPRSRDDRMDTSSNRSDDRCSDSDKEEERRPSNTDKESGIGTPSDHVPTYNEQLDLSKNAVHSGNEGSAEEDDSEDDGDRADDRQPTDLSVNREKEASSPSAVEKLGQSLAFTQQLLNGESANGSSSIETLLLNIQGMLKVAAENARHHERQINYEKAEMKMELMREKEMRQHLERQLAEEQRNRVLYEKKWKKERKVRKRLQETENKAMTSPTFGEHKAMTSPDAPERYSSPDSLRRLNGTDSHPTDSESDRSVRSPTVKTPESDRRLPDPRAGIQSLMESYLASASLSTTTNGYLHPPPPLKADIR